MGAGEARRAGVSNALAVAALVTAAAALHGVSPTTSDPDGFYHIRHAWLYRTQGLFDSSFPWARFSAIREQASDLWYGFHLLLVPFSLPDNLLNGLLVGGVAVTAAALVLLWAGLRCLGLAWPLAWVAAFAATGDVLFRITMLRPHPLSLGLAVLALGLLASADARRRRAGLGLVSLAAAWVHLALAWLVPLVALTFAVFALAHKRRPDAPALAAAFAGALLGALARPHPAGAARLAWIQIGLFLDVKRRGLPLPFGLELQPLSLPLDGPRLVLPALVLLALGLVFALRPRDGPAPVPAEPARIVAWTSLALCLLFTGLSLRVASRSLELAAAFGAAFAGLVFTRHWRLATRRARVAAGVALALALVVMVPPALARYQARAREARPLLAYRGASAWLLANARPGELVFHAWWDQFPHLFFWNPRNHYVSGMDPLFLFARDEARFWQTQHLALDADPGATCARPACGPGQAEPLALVLRRDFGAAFVLVHRFMNPKLDAYLGSRPEFLRVFDDGTDAVYRVQYDAGLPGGAP